jgi:hypothetical protein
MIESLDDLLRILGHVYPEEATLPKAFRTLKAIERLRAGDDPRVVAKAIRSTPKRLVLIRDAIDPLAESLKCSLEATTSEAVLGKARTTLGQLLLGVLAERAFERIYRGTMGTDELRLEDDRESRSDTDYRVINGQGRPVFRINIKFHGSRFRKAVDLVGLEPNDCFALATYKIYLALQKQEKEVLPYIFVIVGVPHLTGEQVGMAASDDLVHLIAIVQSSSMQGKRSVEEQVVDYLVDKKQPESFAQALQSYIEAIAAADWYVLSARKANGLLREKLFDRVYAVRVRAFAKNYRNAELDMHFSLKKDLTPLKDFLVLLKDRGLHGLTAHLERGLV